jgi:DNA-binding transcriptional MerR regulator
VSETLLTIRDLSRELGYRLHQVKHALDIHDIQPHQRAGIVRLYARDQIPEIRRALEATAKHKRREVIAHA